MANDHQVAAAVVAALRDIRRQRLDPLDFDIEAEPLDDIDERGIVSLDGYPLNLVDLVRAILSAVWQPIGTMKSVGGEVRNVLVSNGETVVACELWNDELSPHENEGRMPLPITPTIWTPYPEPPLQAEKGRG